MKDLRISRLIQVAAAGSLLVSMTGCAGKERRAAKLACKAQKECDEDYFEDEFDDLADCVETYQEYIDEFEENVGEDCFKALLDFSICSSKAYRVDCDYEDAYDECEDEVETFYDECADDFRELYDYDYDYDY